MAPINVSVVYVHTDNNVFETHMQIAPQTKIGEVIVQSGLLEAYPQMALKTMHFGVFGVRKTAHDGLHEHDRIEIYRPLLIDPKDRRRAVVDGKRNPKKWRQELPQNRKKTLRTT